jgi:brefeldin A-inhibited guanine nucleotide-exchange protein
MSSLVFVVSSLEAIQASKEAQRSKQLLELAEKALKAIKEENQQLPDPDVLFAPLQLATKTGGSQLTNIALDCIGKLISSSYLSAPDATGATQEDGTERAPLIDRAIDTICDCFQGETTAVDVQRHIVQALLAAVLNDKIVVHGAGLLKAVRQVYNVFLLSRSTDTQQAAQGTLSQMVGMVFERVKTRLHMKEARTDLSKLQRSSSNVTFEAQESVNGNGNGVAAGDLDPDGGEDEDEDGDPDADDSTDAVSVQASSEATPSEATNGGGAANKLTLKDLEHRKSFDDSNLGDGPTMVTQLKTEKRTRSVSGQTIGEGGQEDTAESLDAEDEVYIRDAYLVFRSFCNLSTKILPPDQLYDLRGQPMRSKLISLHLIRTLLNNHIHVFTSPQCTITNAKTNESTNFLQAIKYYLCLSITRNGASSVDRVFEVCCEIFWLMLKFMRAPFKVSFEPTCPIPLQALTIPCTIERDRGLS